MTAGAELLGHFGGQPYGQGPRRTDPNSAYKDCSGLIVASLSLFGVHVPPEFQPVSTGLELWCRSVPTLDGRGLGRTLDEAYGVAGALFFVWGYGDNGHVAFSDGKGGTWETPVPGCHCVGARSAHGRAWTGAALIPGIHYLEGPVPPWVPDPSGYLATLAAEIGQVGATVGGNPIRWGSTGLGVRIVQLELTVKGFPCGTIDGAFGPKTLAAVQAFQVAHHLVADGIVGPLTWHELTT